MPEGNGAANDGTYRTIIRDKSTYDNNLTDAVDMTIQGIEKKLNTSISFIKNAFVQKEFAKK